MRKGNGILITLLTFALTMALCPGIALAIPQNDDSPLTAQSAVAV